MRLGSSRIEEGRDPMKCVLELSEVEKLTLEQLSLNHWHRDIRTRAAGLLMLGNGMSAPKVAKCSREIDLKFAAVTR